MPARETPASDILADYDARLLARRATMAERERQHVRVSRIRLALATLAVGLPLIFGAASAPVVAALAVGFIAAVVVHARTLDRRDRAARAVRWYELGLHRLRDTWMGRGDPGDRLRPADHLYADDLDLFGKGSLFDLLSTPRTRGGQDRLAAWLLSPAPPDVVRARQAAVKELAARPDLRETMAVAGEGVTVNVNALRAWATTPSPMPPPVTAFALGALSAANITLLAWFLTKGTLGGVSLVFMIVQGLVAVALRGRVLSVLRGVDTPSRELGVLAGLLDVLARERFESPALVQLATTIGAHTRPAAAEIARLDRMVSRLSTRQNMFTAIPAALMLWATQCAFAIDGWRRRVGHHVPAWLDAVAEFEALAALATFAAEHPGYVFPTFDAAPAHLSAETMAHPLLPSSAVANDVAIGHTSPHLLVVSGSNMSGKSTFLRAIGVNVVLAHAGAPVRATSFSSSPLGIGASIRVLDSLQDGKSRFFAEISRLKAIVDLTRQHPNGVLFLLDEILSGTNSHDRAHGAEKLVEGLLAAGAIGMITTHDLALSRIAEARGASAANVHFADRFDEGGLSFDYRLRPGPVRTSNALALMRSIGLEV